MADGGRIGFKDGTQLNNEILLEYFKKHKGKKYSEIAKILDEEGYVTKGGRKVTAEALELRAIRGEMTGYGYSKFIETTEDLMKEATSQQLKDYKSGKISEELFRQRVLGKRGDIKRTGTEARKLQSKKYREEAKLPGFEERAKKIKESRFKFREKEYFKKGMPPPAKNAKEELWRSLFTNGQDYKKGRRLKTLGKYSKYISRDKLFNAEILDTKTGKKITFKNLEKYINPKNTGKTYAEVIKPYDQKWFINETPGLRNEINSKLIKGWTKGSKDTFFEIQHNAGKATHPFDVSLSNERVNLKEFGVRNKFEKAWDKTKSISERKNLFKNYIDELPKGIISQPSMVKRARTFGKDVPFDQQLRQLKEEGVKLPKGTLKKAQEKFLSPKHQQLIKNQFCKNAAGGVPGSCPIDEAIDNMIKQTNDVKRGAVKGAEAARIASKASKVARFGTGTGLAKALGPYGIAAEALFEVAFAIPGYARGESGKRLLGDSILGLIPGVGQSEEEEFTEYATKAGMSELEQQKIKDANRFIELEQGLVDMDRAGILEGKGAGRGGKHKGINKFMELQEEYIPLYNQFVGAPPSESLSTMFAEQDRINQSIEEAKAARKKERQESGIVAEDDWYENIDTRGYMGGGIASLKK